jgi:hypothetical protein
VGECGPCPPPPPRCASFTLAFALQLRKKHEKFSVRVRKTSVRLRKISVKHVEIWNKHIKKKKNCASSWSFTRKTNPILKVLFSAALLDSKKMVHIESPVSLYNIHDFSVSGLKD